MAVKTAPPKSSKPLIPPDESVWQKYSSHFELPLASATSVFLHGTVIGIFVIGSLTAFWASDLELTRPPRMDVVMIEGGGSGVEGLGGEPGLPGDPKAGGTKTEDVGPNDTPPDESSKRPPLSPRMQLPELGLPSIDDGKTPANDELAIELAMIVKEADDQVRKEMKIPTPDKSAGGTTKKPGPVGTGNPKGTGGLGGSGGGIGLGKKKGPGMGRGGLGGRAPTEQEAKAGRWRFYLLGDAKEHARKLAAVGVILAFPEPGGGFQIITDLNRRPVERRADNLADFKDAVKWYNTKAESVQPLARELQLPFVPQFFVLLLPKDRERKMAEAEAAYAEQHRRKLDTIQATWFDFRLRNGVYDPVVTKQE